MGFTPRQVDEMTLWEYMHCADGFKLSKGIEETPVAINLPDETRTFEPLKKAG